MLFPDFLLTHHKPLPSGPQGGTITIHCCLAPVLTPLSLVRVGIVSLVTRGPSGLSGLPLVNICCHLLNCGQIL